MPKGKIQKTIKDKGYGFIKVEDGEEIFFHTKNLQGLNSKSIKKGAPVEFDIGKDQLGRLVAINIRATDLYSGILLVYTFALTSLSFL